MRWILAAAMIAFTALALPAVAQVHKCKDSSGRTIYADAPCAAGQSGGLLERRRTESEIHQERIEAAEAEDRKHMQRMAEKDREWAAQSQRASHQRAAPVVRHSGNDWARRKELANAATSASSITKDSGRWDRAAQAQRARANREKARHEEIFIPPTSITNCSGGFCNDNQGGSYNRIDSNYMTGPNGQSCRLVGTTWSCN